MTARTSMGVLITRLRLMVGDPLIAGTPPTSTFTDDQMQDALDHHRTDVLQDLLVPRYSIATNGTTQWLDYQARAGFWEDDVVIVNASWAAVTPTTSDELTGHWTFATSTLPPLRITGKTYDMYGAAVEILEAWSASIRAAGEIVSFSEDGQSVTRSQKTTGLSSLAQEYRRKALPAGPRFTGIGSER